AGETRSCFGMTDKGTAGSNPTLLNAPVVKDGDDYVINAHKWFTTAADGADFCIVMAVTNPDAAPHERASMIIVPLDTPGFEMVRNIPVMGEPGGGWFSHSEIKLTDVRVPQSYLLGEEGAGFLLAQKRLGPGRIHHCMRWMGICQRALELMKSRANEREIKPGETLADTQIVKQWMAECTTEFTAARALILQTAWTIEQQGFAEARDMVSMIKFHAANVTQKILDTALQLHGGLGMTDDTPIAYWWRHERAARIFDGPDEVHKLSLGKRLLRA
ncbi:MAG: acyl-CoA dehydrogenase family protein, partial [Salinisphaeraceae bacterium]|nr:acyl-CoA dehydrogenase family protein [Salinisphaeraceae bacterium]